MNKKMSINEMVDYYWCWISGQIEPEWLFELFEEYPELKEFFEKIVKKRWKI